ncbi:MAG: vitamin K epoxide reductase family protein [Candidatus Micrarchaeia archaeon]
MRVTKQEIVILTTMSIIGLASSLIVIYELNVLGTLPPLCTLPNGPSIFGARLNCAKVLLSSYSDIDGISLDLLAAIWFIMNLGLVIALVSVRRSIAKMIFRILFVWRFIGLAIVPYLIYLEFIVLHSICIYCTIMHGAIIIDFIIITFLVFSEKSKIKRDIFG